MIMKFFCFGPGWPLPYFHWYVRSAMLLIILVTHEWKLMKMQRHFKNLMEKTLRKYSICQYHVI